MRTYGQVFVKKVGGDVALMEEQVTQAETNLGTFPNPLKKIFQNLSASPLFSPTVGICCGYLSFSNWDIQLVVVGVFQKRVTSAK